MRATPIGFALMIAGIGIFVFTLGRLMYGPALDPQVKVPGTITVEVEEPGRHYLWDQHFTRFEGERVKYSDDCPKDVKVSVVSSTGDTLPFVQDASQSWSIGNSGKTSVGYVDVPGAMTLDITVDGTGRERIFSVSGRTTKDELWLRLRGFGVSLVVGLLGLCIAFVGMLGGRRRGAEDAYQASA